MKWETVMRFWAQSFKALGGEYHDHGTRMANSPDGKEIRVLIVEDHDKVRAGIRAILNLGGDINIVGEAADGARAIDLANQEGPDVILLDLELPVLKGETVMSRVLAKNPDMRVLILTSYDDPEYAMGMLAEGAAGYLLKEEAPQLLLKAVRSLHSEPDKTWISPRLLR
jgi:DNA-binding NarL/FixJ family response regulator